MEWVDGEAVEGEKGKVKKKKEETVEIIRKTIKKKKSHTKKEGKEKGTVNWIDNKKKDDFSGRSAAVLAV